MTDVCIVKCNNYEENNVISAIDRVFLELGGADKFIKKGCNVAIKPNLLLKKQPEYAVTTHPSIIKALSMIIIKAGAKATIVESPGGMYSESSLKAIYKATGMEKVAQETGIKLNFDLSVKNTENKDAKFLKRLNLIKPLIDADIIINVPKMKSHGQMVYTGAVKNMFGAVPGIYKAEYHLRMSDCENFADSLIDIFLSVKPVLNILDAVVGMDGDGPSAGDPKHVGLILAGPDAFTLDMVTLAVLKVNPVRIPLTEAAIKRGLCPFDMNEIKIRGEKLEDVIVSDFRMPALKSSMSIKWVNKGILGNILNKLKPSPRFNHKICISCGDCEKNCPARIISMKNRKPEADLNGCIRCFCCQELCPVKAVEIYRPFITRLLLN